MIKDLVHSAGTDEKGLEEALDQAQSVITREYLSRMERMTMASPGLGDDHDITKCGHFFRLSRLVTGKEDHFLDKLTTVVNVAASLGCTFSVVIRSDGESVEYDMGILSVHAVMDNAMNERKRQSHEKAFRGILEGHFPGSKVEALTPAELEALKARIADDKQGYAAVSGIVSLRKEAEKNLAGYVQGLDNLADSLQGIPCTVMLVAEPVDGMGLQQIRQGYENLYTQLSVYQKQSLSLNESTSSSTSMSISRSLSEGITTSIAMTQGQGSSSTTSSGSFKGFGIGAGLFGTGLNFSRGNSSGTGKAQFNQSSDTRSTARSSTRQTGTAESRQLGTASGRTLQLQYENRTVTALLDRLDTQLKRIDACESLGAFQCAAYIMTEDEVKARAVAGEYNALIRGQSSGIQTSCVNSWDKGKDRKKLGQYLSNFAHPRFYLTGKSGTTVTPASLISGNELAVQIGFPRRSLPGVTVMAMTPFGRNVPRQSGSSFLLGRVHHMGRDEEREVWLDVNSLAMHTFITGSTGSGKSNAVYTILEALRKQKAGETGQPIRFMVVEPAKGEYKNRFGHDGDVSVYGTNSQKTPLLRINPFSFPSDVHVLEHIERLMAIFNVCWPMYAAMPAVLKDALEEAYRQAGWNLDTSACRWKDSRGTPLYPDFEDVLHQIGRVMDVSSYSADSRSDYKGALMTRVKSLTNGLYRQIFTSREIPEKDLFDQNVIIDLSRIGSSETKALIMGILVMKLEEYRMASSAGSNEPLRHVTVLEEAHHLLRQTEAVPSESAGLAEKSVEMLANAIAEMRTYGEGFIIADQAPGLLDRSVIRNTNTKIILRLPDLADRELAGRAAGLNDGQIAELARLEKGVAAVFQNDWPEPVLCHIKKEGAPSIPAFVKPEAPVHDRSLETELLHFMVLPFEKRKALDDAFVDNLRDAVFHMGISAETKAAFLQYVTAETRSEVRETRGKFLYGLLHGDALFISLSGYESDVSRWYGEAKRWLQKESEGMNDLNAQEQRSMLAILAEERNRLERSAASVSLFDRLMGVL